MSDTGPVVKVGLDAIHAELMQVKSAVIRLEHDLPMHVTITKTKQEEYDTRLASHGSRLTEVEHRLTRLEAAQRPATPWYQVVGAVAVIISAVVTVATVLSITP